LADKVRYVYNSAQLRPFNGTLKLFVLADDLFSMTRTTSFAAWMVLACATASAASRAETTTYVDGNLTGVSPNTGGTLLFSDDKSMYFRTGLATIAVPYAAITKSELGATRSNSHGVAFYKVWARHRKTETQFLMVEFKNEEGEQKNMTLELAQGSAPSVLETIQNHTAQVASAKPEPSAAEPAPQVAAANPAPPPPAPAPAPVVSSKPKLNRADGSAVASPPTKPGSEWWGDDMWKTKRNADLWPTKPAGTIAPQ
jgi:hypothetical protein